jgi:hypothetical protein
MPEPEIQELQSMIPKHTHGTRSRTGSLESLFRGSYKTTATRPHPKVSEQSPAKKRKVNAPAEPTAMTQQQGKKDHTRVIRFTTKISNVSDARVRKETTPVCTVHATYPKLLLPLRQSVRDFVIFLDQYRMLESENARLQAESRISSSEARALHEEIDLLRGEKADFNQGIQDLESENATLAAGHDALKLKNYESEETMRDLNRQVTKLKADVGQREKENEQLMTKIERLDRQAESAEQKLEISKEKLKNSEQKLKTFKQRVKVFVNEF